MRTAWLKCCVHLSLSLSLQPHYNPPPGTLARNRIQAWYDGDECQALVKFVKDDPVGQSAYTQVRCCTSCLHAGVRDVIQVFFLFFNADLFLPSFSCIQLRRDSTAAFPQYADELRGIADGAEVTLDMVSDLFGKNR